MIFGFKISGFLFHTTAPSGLLNSNFNWPKFGEAYNMVQISINEDEILKSVEIFELPGKPEKPESFK
jgi:hypothetical protein